MSDKLNQKVAAGGQAIQSQGDVTIYRGMSSEQMIEIMSAMAKQLAVYHAEAQREAEKRFKQLEEDVVKRFSEGKNANPEAFKQPDFQYALNEGLRSYARSGDETLRGTLVDIISRRSLAPERTRLAIALDDAIVKTASLSSNEFAELSLAYILLSTERQDINNFARFSDYIKAHIVPFLSDISEESSSYSHLQAQGCASLAPFGGKELTEIWKLQYGGVLGKGVSREQLEETLPPDKRDLIDNKEYFIPCLHDETKFQPNALNKNVFVQRATATGLTPEQVNSLWDQFANTVFSEQELCDKLRSEIPNIERLFVLWKKTPLKRLILTTIGFALGHAYAVSKVGFEASLDIWIK